MFAERIGLRITLEMASYELNSLNFRIYEVHTYYLHEVPAWPLKHIPP